MIDWIDATTANQPLIWYVGLILNDWRCLILSTGQLELTMHASGLHQKWQTAALACWTTLSHCKQGVQAVV